MPKISDDEDLDDEEIEDDEIEDEEIEEELRRSSKPIPGRPKEDSRTSRVPTSTPAKVNPNTSNKGSVNSIKQNRNTEEKPQVKRRFAIMAPQPIRVVDAEAEEVVGEGDYAVLQVLTDIIERLERIENTLGSMVEG